MKSARAPRREGEVLVRFRAGVSGGQAEEAARSRGARRARRLRGGSRVERLEIDPGLTPEDVAASLLSDPAVEFAEPNYLVAKDSVTPDDPRFPEQWALRNEGGGAGHVAGADIRAPQAWGVTTGSLLTVVAVVDGGIDFSHPDLGDNRWVNSRERPDRRDNDRNGYADDFSGWDWVSDAAPTGDPGGHGTAVAGLIAARGDNGEGVAGVMWQARLMDLRVLDANGAGDVARAVEAIDYAVAHGAQVINCSWGAAGESRALRAAVERAASRGVVVVASAGNAGRDLDASPYYPASFDLQNVIAVAATDSSDRIAAWSNYGPGRAHIAAPGVDLLTTGRGGSYARVSGTSAAAPLVSGIAGLLKTVRPLLRAERARDAVITTARRPGGLEGKVAAGGVVDASAALAAVAAWPQIEEFDLPPEESNLGRDDGRSHHNPGGGTLGARRDRQTGPPPQAGKFRRNQPNLDELRRRATSDPLRAPSPIPSQRPDYERGAPFKAPGGAINSDWVSTGRYSGSTLSVARLDPANRTGMTAEDLFSGNYNWVLPIVNIPGRSGLDLSLSLSYNSLVWTKLGFASVFFDEDRGFPSPGFRLGFPVIQSQFYNETTGKNAYLLVTPTGGRVELRQVGASNVYEAADSSYLQLTDYGATKLLRATDGTQLTYAAFGGQFHCTEVKDRNGNYLTVAYNGSGKLSSVTDTLGRVVGFNYDGNGRLSNVTQTRGGTTYTWATFGYTSHYMSPNFPGMWVYGPYNQAISVLTHVWMADSSLHQFTYNPFGQVYRIERKAPAGNLLSRTSYNLPTASVAHSDCPRFTERRDWAAEWNGDDGGTYSASEEAVTAFGSEAGDVQTVTAPDGTVHKEFNHTSGWQRGLTYQTETWSGGIRKKWMTANWTQDDTGLGYRQNPRVTETNVWDAEGSRRRRTGFEYHASFGLPHVVVEYAADASTVLRRTYTDYNLDPAYVSRRVIGLVSARAVYDGNWNLMSKVFFGYDWDWNGDMFQDTPAPATQHDRANYGPSFITGRGNLSQVARYDVNDPHNANNTVVETKWRVNSTGSVLMERDHLWHQRFFDYADSFSDGNNSRNTFAYQTATTDADNYTSSLQYDFNTGLVTRTQDPKGAVRQIQYDPVGRLERVTTLFNGAYRRLVYPSDLTFVQSFATVNNVADESYAISLLDGNGRVISAAGGLPASAGGYRGQHFIYDVLGRVVEQTNPAEMTGSWSAAGDDVGGWQSNFQTYDWNGRPLIATNSDGTTRELTYDGCGCAGGQVVTSADEMGRKQRTSYDVFGRLWKTEMLNSSGGIYRTTTNTYNARDQVTEVSDQATGGATQFTLLTYDGHGRLNTRQFPHEASPTTFNYRRDDLVDSVTDARGVTNTISYNNRHLITGVDYGMAAGVEPEADVTYAYDSAGNRTQMVEAGFGQVDYTYDTLSRLTAETRQFAGLAGSYQLSYTYNLGGQVNSISSPHSATAATTAHYNHDAEGQVQSVTASGTLYGGVTTYASAIRYRAWGALRSLTYGNGMWLLANYDERMLMSRFELGGRTTQYGDPSTAMLKQYSYYADRQPRFADDGVDDRFDRAFAYDHAARVKDAYTGQEARNFVNNVPGGATDGPYRQTYHYDAWGNLTGRDTRFWSQTDAFTAAYANNRRQGHGYDAAGNVLNDGSLIYTYDAAGRSRHVSDYGTVATTQWHSGDGQVVKRMEQHWGDEGQPPWTETTYYLRSTVLGGRVLTELSGTGAKQTGNVYLGAEVLASHYVNVEWKHRDPVGKSHGTSYSGAWFIAGAELDAAGVDVGTYDPLILDAPPPTETEAPSLLGGFGMPSGRCTLDGMPILCVDVPMLVGSGSAVFAPQENVQTVIYQGKQVLAVWQAYSDGYQGYLPVTATYRGAGHFGPIGGFSQPRMGHRSEGFDTKFQRLNGATGERRMGRIPEYMLIDIKGPELAKIADDIRDVVSKPKCQEFLKQLFKQLNTLNPDDPTVAGDILGAIDDIVGQEGLVIVGNKEKLRDKSGYYSTVGGSQRNRTSHLLLNTAGVSTSEALLTVIHESLHRAGQRGGYDDRQLAEAVFEIRKAQGLDMTGVRKLPANKKDVMANSSYWNQALSGACNPSIPSNGSYR